MGKLTQQNLLYIILQKKKGFILKSYFFSFDILVFMY